MYSVRHLATRLLGCGEVVKISLRSRKRTCRSRQTAMSATGWSLLPDRSPSNPRFVLKV